jgi:hypothetical protein
MHSSGIKIDETLIEAVLRLWDRRQRSHIYLSRDITDRYFVPTTRKPRITKFVKSLSN